MECSNQKSVKQIQIYFRFFKVTTLYLDDSFAHYWHSLNQLHLECFSNSLGSSHICWEFVDCFSFTLRSNSSQPPQLGWGQLIVVVRSSDAALHHSPSWSNSQYPAWRCVLGHCPVEKQMIVPSSNQIVLVTCRCYCECSEMLMLPVPTVQQYLTCNLTIPQQLPNPQVKEWNKNIYI